MRTWMFAAVVSCLLGAVWTMGCGGGGSTDEGPSGPMLDQAYHPPFLPSKSYYVGMVDHAQIFTAGITGRLTRVVLVLARGQPGEIRLQIRSGQAGAPGVDAGTVLAEGSLSTETDLGGTPGSFTWELGAQSLDVTAGSQYAICLITNGGECVWIVSEADEYAGGAAFFRTHASPEEAWTSTLVHDMVFETWVQP